MPALPKPTRVVNEKLLEAYRLKPCAACFRTPSDPDHIQTRGAGGGDEERNLLPLCRACHTQRHALGWFRFCIINPRVIFELEKKGWHFAGRYLMKS